MSTLNEAIVRFNIETLFQLFSKFHDSIEVKILFFSFPQKMHFLVSRPEQEKANSKSHDGPGKRAN